MLPIIGDTTALKHIKCHKKKHHKENQATRVTSQASFLHERLWLTWMLQL